MHDLSAVLAECSELAYCYLLNGSKGLEIKLSSANRLYKGHN